MAYAGLNVLEVLCKQTIIDEREKETEQQQQKRLRMNENGKIDVCEREKSALNAEGGCHTLIQRKQRSI